MQQNIALRTNIGCVKISDIYGLHNEGKMLPVQAHRELLEEQVLAGSY